MSTTSFQDEGAVVVVEAVGIVGNSEGRGELSTMPQPKVIMGERVPVAAYADEI